MLSPLHVKRSFGLTRGKNDKVDSYLISKYAYLHREELELTKQPSLSLKSLRNLLNERERLVRMLVSEKQVLSELEKNSENCSIERTKLRLEGLERDIKAIEREMKQIITTNESLKSNYLLMESVVGISLINSVYFLVYTVNFTAFTDPRKFACYSGVAPFEHSSGSSIRGKTRVSHLANKKIKACLSNGARSAVQNDPELKKYYKRKEKEGKEHGVIMNAIKFKLITRVFATYPPDPIHLFIEKIPL
jgi:transposase